MTTIDNILSEKCTKKYGFVYVLKNEERNINGIYIFKGGCVEAVDRTVNDRLNEHNSRKKSTDTICPWEPVLVWKVPQPVEEREKWLFEMLENNKNIQRRSWPSGKKSEQFMGKTADINVIDYFRQLMKFVGEEINLQNKDINHNKLSTSDVNNKLKRKTYNISKYSAIHSKKNKKQKTSNHLENKDIIQQPRHAIPRSHPIRKDRLFRYLYPCNSIKNSPRFGALRQAKLILYHKCTMFGFQLSLSDSAKDYSDNWIATLPNGEICEGIDRIIHEYISMYFTKLSGGNNVIRIILLGRSFHDRIYRFCYEYDNGRKFSYENLESFKNDWKVIERYEKYYNDFTRVNNDIKKYWERRNGSKGELVEDEYEDDEEEDLMFL